MPYLAIAAITAFVILFLLKLPMSRLDVSYTFAGDAIEKQTQVQNVAETGWLFHSDRLGYPFGYDRLDFPRLDSLNYVFMGPIAALSGSSGLAMNLYYLASFFLIALGAFWTLRRMQMQDGVAGLCALLYAFLPYHILRGVEHVTNGAYFLVAPAMLVLAWVAQGHLVSGEPGARKRWLFAVTIAILLPLQTPYNGVFFAMLCVVAGAIAVAARPHWRMLLPAVVLATATAFAFLLEQAPVMLHAQEVGEAAAADRSPIESETYALHLNQVLLPPAQHRITALADAKQRFDAALQLDAPFYEIRDQYIGLFGILGLAALLWSLARGAVSQQARHPSTTTELERTTRVLALLAICVLLLAMSSGGCNLIAFFVTTKIRAYNRILPFLAFPCLVGAGWMLQNGLKRIADPWLGAAVLVAIGGGALLDTLVKLPLDDRIHTLAAYDRSLTYFASIERRLGDGAALFQLPVVWYPEHPPVNRMGDYEEFKPFLSTRSLRISYGGGIGRKGYLWGKAVEALPAKEAVKEWNRMGFAGVLIDASAYADDATLQAIVQPLAALLPESPIVSANRRWWTFPLQGCCASETAAPRGSAIPDSAYNPGTLLSFRDGGRGGLYATNGWSTPESWGTWSLGEQSTLRMVIQPLPDAPLSLAMTLHAMTGPLLTRRHLRVVANGSIVGDTDFVADEGDRHFDLPLPAGVIGKDGILEIRFDVTPKATPQSAGINTDTRPLGIGLSELSITSLQHRSEAN